MLESLGAAALSVSMGLDPQKVKKVSNACRKYLDACAYSFSNGMTALIDYPTPKRFKRPTSLKSAREDMDRLRIRGPFKATVHGWEDRRFVVRPGYHYYG